MRRQLLLVRHAKSSWDDVSLADHDRPLAPRGTHALADVHDHLVRSEHRPGVVLCSTALRAIQTLDGIREAIPEHADIVVTGDLYGTGADSVLALLHDVADDVECAMVVGHNPTLQQLALMLVGAGRAAIRGRLATKLPTGAVVTVSFDGPWAGLRAGTAELDDLYTPRRPRP